MNRELTILTLAAAMMSGCSSTDVEQTYEEQLQTSLQVPVAFGTFVGNAADTRAGAGKTGSIQGQGTTTSTAVLAQKGGFGVFAFQTDNGRYQSATSPINFMYNEHVTSADGGNSWTYAPQKFWPNEHSTSNTIGASVPANGDVEKLDRLSFQAYAPWTGDTANGYAYADDLNEGGTEVGITGFNANSALGDVIVSYRSATRPENSVDLLYARNADSDDAGGLKDQLKPSTGSKVRLEFVHALARMDLAVRAVFDDTDPESTKDFKGDFSQNDNKTVIALQSVTLTSAKLGVSGDLNLRTGKWSNFTKGGTLSISGSDIALTDGKVTHQWQQLMPEGRYFMFVPTDEAATDFTVRVKYTVTTEDPALSASNSVVTNEITNTVSFKPEKCKAYRLRLVLGMTTVKLSAEVTDWTASDVSPVWVPVNKN